MRDAKEFLERARSTLAIRSSMKRRRRARVSLIILASATLGTFFAASLRAQTVDDEFVLAKHEFLTGISYSHDEWDQYWEGARKRRNGNIGAITTQAAVWSGSYGVTDKLSVIAAVPYVWTHASQGVLHDMQGFQDLTIAGKYQLLARPFTSQGSIRAMAVVAGGVPLSDYTPDFQPLSLGSASERISGRLTLNFLANRGWFVNGTTAYTWRSNVTLDRPYYYTDGRLFLTNEVDMPNVFDYMLGAGYARAGLMGSLYFSEQRTRGGGDIRRQDAPFVSNRANFSRVGATMAYSPAQFRALEFRLSYAYTVDGRNVGQSATVTSGFTYRFDLGGTRPQ